MRPTLLLAPLLLIAGGLRAAPTEAQLRKIAARFNTDDGHGRLVAFSEFDKAVAPADRADALARLWELGLQNKGSTAPQSVLVYLSAETSKGLSWNDRLRGRVIEASKSKDHETRRLTLNLLAKRNTPDVQPYVLAFLEDPSDDLREQALAHVSRWPNRKDVFTSYVQKQEKTKGRERSVAKARFFLEKEKKK